MSPCIVADGAADTGDTRKDDVYSVPDTESKLEKADDPHALVSHV